MRILSFYTRDKTRDLVQSIAPPVRQHLIKILKWDDQLNYHKHVDDIDQWLVNVSELRMKPNGKLPSPKNYYDWLFTDFDSQSSTDYVVRILRSRYDRFPTLLIDQQLYDKLRSLYKQLSVDLSFRQFEGIQHYLKG